MPNAPVNGPCAVEGCSGRVRSKPYCEKHRAKWRRYGDPVTAHPQIKGACAVAGCVKPYSGRGYCRPHLRRAELYGDPLAGHPNYAVAPELRFWRHVDKNGANGCWIWMGTRASGYGRFQIRSRKSMQAHRFAYEVLRGRIPDGLTIDHLCRVPSCVNPSHMEIVSLRENVLRGNAMGARWARRTRCQNGHEFDGVRANGARSCSICKKAADHAKWLRIKALRQLEESHRSGAR